MFIASVLSTVGPLVRAPQPGFEQSSAARLLSIATVSAENLPARVITITHYSLALALGSLVVILPQKTDLSALADHQESFFGEPWSIWRCSTTRSSTSRLWNEWRNNSVTPEPCLPSPADTTVRFHWIHEIKHDGYGLMARHDPVGIRLITRRGNDWTTRYPLVAEAVNHLKVRSCLIDGDPAEPPWATRAHTIAEDRRFRPVGREPYRPLIYCRRLHRCLT
jgi:hypothetical protein